MKRMILSCSFLIMAMFFQKALAQDTTKSSFYIFNADWTPIKDIKQAKYFMEEIHKSDSIYVLRYYNFSGPMVRQESYSDSNFLIKNGRFCWYKSNGDLDSTVVFNNGTMIPNPPAPPPLKKGAPPTKDTTVTFKGVQTESTFKGGLDAWAKYIQHNLQTPDRAMSVLGTGIHTATICFTINKEGHPQDVYMNHSIEWSADAEVFRIIENSPPWVPATQNGKTVLNRKMQPISFSISEN